MSDKSVFIIAEIAQAHDGSLGIAHSFIDSLKDTGIDAVKFQMHIAEAESSIYEPFRKKFSYVDKSRYDYWKRMEFSFEQWKALKTHCEENRLEFLVSPFSNAAVDILEKLSVKRYKIGSGEVTNLLMLEKIGKTGKPVILSSGMSSMDELDKAVEILKSNTEEVSVLQCTTAYPTVPEDWGLEMIAGLRGRYKIPVGFSDHSGNIFASLAAASLGAEIIEFHVAFDKMMFGPDASASLTIDEVRKTVEGIRQIERSLNHPVEKGKSGSNTELKMIFEKSLAVNRNVKAGDLITTDMLEAKKPKGYGIPAEDYRSVIGKTFRNNLPAWAFIKPEDING